MDTSINEGTIRLKGQLQDEVELNVTACELVSDGINRSIVGEKLGINVVMLFRWIDEYQTLGEAAFVGSGHQRPENARLKRLEKENERLRMENEILKKQRHTLRTTQETNKVCPRGTERV